MSIESLLHWAYADELVHAARREGMPIELAVRHSPGLARLAGGIAEAKVDGGLRADFEAPADAYRVHAAVMGLGTVDVAVPGNAAWAARDAFSGELVGAARGSVFRLEVKSVVFRHAMSGDRPDWIAVPALRMKPGTVVYNAAKRPWFCKVEPEGDTPDQVMHARAVYAAWVDALARLAAAMRGRLERHVLDDSLPVRAPWLHA